MGSPDVQNTKNDSNSTVSETMLAPRRTALVILASILNAHQPLDTVLEINPDFKKLEGRDRAFVRMLVTTTLRRCGEIDALIQKAQDRPDHPLQPVLKNILRLGLAQILFLNVPDHAAVDTSVRLAENQGHAKFKGFVNAVLRNILRNQPDWSQTLEPEKVNIPLWLYDLWEVEYGPAQTLEMSKASLAEAPLDLTSKDPSKAKSIAASVGGTILWNGTIRLDPGSGQIPELEGYRDGSWWVQDMSASLPVGLMGDLTGKDVIDLCAAPGGKTAQLASKGAYVKSLDRSARRLERFMDNMRRLRLESHVEPVTADASVWHPKEQADIVLLDAPCTATGTIRRNPDMHLKTENDVRKMTGVQKTLLKNAAAMVKPGGTLIYCTCSLQKEEGEDQIDGFLSGDVPFRLVPYTADEVAGHTELINEDGHIRCLPNMMADSGGMDGFFVARLVRI